MSTFAFLLLCIQACLVQQVFSQCSSRAAVEAGFGAPYALSGPGLPGPGLGAAGLSSSYNLGGLGNAYGNNLGLSAGNIGYSNLGGYGAGYGPYGGAGEGNVAAVGELPVAGSTAVAGQVPIMGAVSFGGAVPAAGAVTISGNCACGCSDYAQGPYGAAYYI